MAPLWVVEHLDVVEDIGLGIGSRGVGLAAHALALEQLEEALDHRVVVAVAAPAHAADQLVGLQELLPFFAGELTALVRVQQNRRFGLAAPQRHDQRAQHQIGVDARAHAPADDLAREQVQHHGQVQPALVRADVGDVGHPGLVGLLDLELALQVMSTPNPTPWTEAALKRYWTFLSATSATGQCQRADEEQIQRDEEPAVS